MSTYKVEADKIWKELNSSPDKETLNRLLYELKTLNDRFPTQEFIDYYWGVLDEQRI